jgi:hypothetical protein
MLDLQEMKIVFDLNLTFLFEYFLIFDSDLTCCIRLGSGENRSKPRFWPDHVIPVV